jgi:hypothetical protein
VDDHPVLRRPFYHVPHRAGITGTAANFVLHVSDLMDGKARLRSVTPAHGVARSMVSLAEARTS